MTGLHRVLFAVFSAGGRPVSVALQQNLAIPGKLADAALHGDDTLPSLSELRHWSFGLTHAAIVAGIAIGTALAIHWVLFFILRRVARRADGDTESVAIRNFNQSIRWAMVTMAFASASAASKLLYNLWNTIDDFVIPALIGWVLLSLISTMTEMLHRRLDTLEDVMAARSRNTRITLLSRSVSAVIFVVTIAMIMLGFPGVRHIGTTIIASAGLLTLAVGAAAQPALKSLIAGLQIAITQPIRIGDFVVIDGDQGRVEDIRFSYVVIRTADERRLIVPTTKFLDNTFQNWTRANGLTGSVILPLLPNTPIGAVRDAFEAIMDKHDDWDRRAHSLSVSDVRPGVVEVKMLVTAAGPAEMAVLRAAVREQMVEWMRDHLPTALVVDTNVT